MKKRILSMLLAIVMVVGLMPGTVLAAASTAEAEWGDSASSITGSGDFTDAIASGASYIRLLTEADMKNNYISLGENSETTVNLTLDLNGNTLSSTTSYFIKLYNAALTVVDTSTSQNGGITVSSACKYVFALYEDNSHLIAEQGTFEFGSGGAIFLEKGTAELKNTVAVSSSRSKGRSIFYKGGLIDLTAHSDPTAFDILTMSGTNVAISDSTIKLPAGYAVFDSSGNEATTFGSGKAYTIGVKAVTPDAYTVTIADDITNGTVEADVTEAAEGATVTLTATPVSGYGLDTLTVSDGTNTISTTAGSNGTYTFTMPASNVTVTAVFEEQHKHDLNGYGDDISWIAWESTNSLPTEAGNYYLTANVNLGSTAWDVPAGETKICLNGKELKAKKISIASGNTLTVSDCGNTGTVKRNGGFGQSGTIVEIAGTFNLYGGSITGNTNWYGYGGGVINNGTFNMYGGAVTKNSADRMGGGVYNASGAVFNMYGGSITQNSGGTGGGLYNGGKFNMYGGEITGNRTDMDSYGGVYSAGSIKVSGKVIISSNKNNDGNPSNYCSVNNGGVIVIAGTLEEGSSIGVTRYQNVGTITTGGDEYIDYFFSDNTQYFVEKDGDNLKLSEKEFTVTVTSSNANYGTASASVVSGKKGTQVRLTAKPAGGYRLKDWTVISGNVTVYRSDYDFFYIGVENVEIQAVFEEIPAVTNYDLWIGGVQVTSANLSGTGWTYAPDTNTLTLNGANIVGVSSADAYKSAAIYTELSTLKIVVEGNSTVTGAAATKTNSAGIYSCGDLTVTGSGILTAVGGAAGNNDPYGTISAGISAASGKTITITDANVTAKGGDALYRSGVSSGIVGSVLVIDNSTVNAVGGTTGTNGSPVSAGIGGSGNMNLTVSGNSAVTATGTKRGIHLYGGTFTVNGGEVKAISTASDAFSANGTKTINGGTVICEGAAGYDAISGMFTTTVAGKAIRYTYKDGTSTTNWQTDSNQIMASNYIKLTVDNPDPIYHTITFITNGGKLTGEGITEVEANSKYTMQYKEGDGAVLPETIEREGHSFVGWRDNSSLTGGNYGSLGTSANYDITYYAKWTANEYKIIWSNGDGGSYEQDVVYGGTVTVPDNDIFSSTMRKTGYTLTGWVNDNGFEVGDSMPAQDLTFTAQYTGNSYTVTFDTNGGETIAPITVTYGENYGRLPSSAITGLSGGDSNWYLVDESGNVTDTKITKLSKVTTARDHTLKVVRKVLAPTLKITLTAPGCISDGYQYYNPENSTRVLTVTVNNMNTALLDYTYIWYKNDVLIDGASSSVLTLEGNVSDSGNYKVKVTAALKDGTAITVAENANTAFSEKEQTVTIRRLSNTLSYDANGGTNAPGSHYTGGKEITVSAGVPERDGYAFAGWNTAANGEGDTYRAGETYTFANDTGNGGCKVTLYAQWSECYDIWVGGVRISGINMNDVLGDGGSVKYDPDTNTLTLTDAAVKNTEGSGIYAENMDLTVNGVNTAADGENTITGTDVTETGVDEDGDEYTDTTPGNGIEVQNGSLTIIGKLGDITSGESGDGIIAAGDVTIGENSTVGNITAGGSGISSMGDVTIAGTVGNITADEDGGGNGIGAEGDVTVSGTVGNISAGYAGLYTTGGDITVSGTIGNITGGSAEAGGSGIEAHQKENYDEDTEESYYTDGDVTITGTVGKITGGASGIYADGILTVDNTTVVAAAEDGYAFLAGNGYLLTDVIISYPEVYDLGSVEMDTDIWYSTVGTNNWTDDEDSFTPASSVTFEPGYTVSFYDALGNGTHEQGIPTGKTARVPVNPTCEGYTFEGWYTSNDYGETLEGKYDFATSVTADVSLYAKWTANRYTVTLITNGGKIRSGNVTGYTYGVGAKLPTNIIRIGYLFDGWYENEDYTGTPVTEIGTTDLGDKTFYAKWNEDAGPALPLLIKYDISVSDDIVGGTVTTDKSGATAGTKVTVSVRPIDGYEVQSVTVTDTKGNSISVTNVGDGTYSFTMPARNVTVYASFTEIETPDSPNPACPKDYTCPISRFPDANAKAWYHDGAHYCIEQGLMKGFDDGTFRPDTTTSRAMIVTILWRLEGSPVVNYLMSFDDVSTDAWYTEAIRWAQANGIVEGYSDEVFGPNDDITREQLATILYRYEQYKGGGFTGTWDGPYDYIDLADVSEWAYEAMCRMNMNDVVQGKPGKVLDPKGNATRAEAATMLYRYCEVSGKDDEN